MCINLDTRKVMVSIIYESCAEGEIYEYNKNYNVKSPLVVFQIFNVTINNKKKKADVLLSKDKDLIKLHRHYFH